MSDDHDQLDTDRDDGDDDGSDDACGRHPTEHDRRTHHGGQPTGHDRRADHDPGRSAGDDLSATAEGTDRRRPTPTIRSIALVAAVPNCREPPADALARVRPRPDANTPSAPPPSVLPPRRRSRGGRRRDALRSGPRASPKTRCRPRRRWRRRCRHRRPPPIPGHHRVAGPTTEPGPIEPAGVPERASTETTVEPHRPERSPSRRPATSAHGRRGTSTEADAHRWPNHSTLPAGQHAADHDRTRR